MKIIEPSYEILDRRSLSLKEKIEYAGRTAYKSEDKITVDSADGFVDKIMEKGHMPVMEFANVHILVTIHKLGFGETDSIITEFFTSMGAMKYINMSVVDQKVYDEDSDGKLVDDEDIVSDTTLLLSGTLRAWMEALIRASEFMEETGIVSTIILEIQNGTEFFPVQLNDSDGILYGNADLIHPHVTCKFLSSTEVFDILTDGELDETIVGNHMMVAVKFICNRAVSHELVRHRPVTIIQESQRYCNYGAKKFGNEVTFIEPMFFERGSKDYLLWKASCQIAEDTYLELLKNNSAQASRTVLPNSCKTEVILYATINEWIHIEDMRTAPGAEPSMRQLTIPLFEEFFTKSEFWE